MILSLSPALTETDFIGGDSKEDPPVPFPNTEVKLFCADGTARATMWESRSPPISLYKKAPIRFILIGAFFCSNILPDCAYFILNCCRYRFTLMDLLNRSFTLEGNLSGLLSAFSTIDI